MFDMTQVGIRIAALRRGRDMTQLALADQLGISHQAVSKWERGESMPDISTLPLLAKLFDTTVDYLLGGEAGAKSDKQARIIGQILERGGVEGEIAPEDLADVAPLLKPSQVRAAAGALGQVDIGDLTALAPFLDRETLDQVARSAASAGNVGDLSGIAPFISRGVLDELARSAVSAGDLGDLCGIAPFVSRDVLDELARSAISGGDLGELSGIAPFVSRDVLDELARSAISGGDLGELCGIAPFISRDVLDEIARKAASDGDLGELAGLAPFLSKGVLKEIIRNWKDGSHRRG